MKLYLNERPRTFIITLGAHALIVRHPFPTYSGGNHAHHLAHHHHHHHGSTVGGADIKASASAGLASSFKVIVEFVPKETLQLTNFRDITPNKSKLKQIFGFLGFLNVKSNIHMGFITQRRKLALPIVVEDIYAITGVDFYCLNNDAYDHLIGRDVEEHQLLLQEQLQAAAANAPGSDRITLEYPAASVKRLLGSGSFFYLSDFDITSNIQDRGLHKESSHTEECGLKSVGFHLLADSPYFRRFMWNLFMNAELIEFRNKLSPLERQAFDLTGFLTTITRGYAQTVNTMVLPTMDALLTIILKQLCMKNGPLFGDWGCDDSGEVSNFVETEVVVYTEQFCFAYVIVRGNVPIFWELENKRFRQKSILSSKHLKRLVYPRSFEASQHAFARHFEKLYNQFGEVYIVNALSQDYKTYKGDLNKTFQEHIHAYNAGKEPAKEVMNEELASKGLEPPVEAAMVLNTTSIPLSKLVIRKFGYNSAQPPDILNQLYEPIIDFGAFFYDSQRHANTGKQLGVFRINSFDLLAKANFLSKTISQEVIVLALRDVGFTQVDHDLLVKHGRLWAANDEQLTKLTVNFVLNSTKLHKSSAATTKGTIKSHFTRKYLSGVVIEPKPNEMAMLKLLGRLQDQVSVIIKNPMHDYVFKKLKKRAKEFSSFKDVSFFASTFNVNGHVEQDEKRVKDWLYPPDAAQAYDVVFIGLQEIVELSPGQMVNTNSNNRLSWVKLIKRILELHSPVPNTKYVSLWDGQLGGIALLLYVKEVELVNISNVEGSFKKTGLGGMSANKGGVSVSFYYSNTQICLVASHLAAGLHNVDERHQNYKTIAKGSKFSKNRKIRDHDFVIWLGDFNYRINTLTNEQVKLLIDKQEWLKLFEYDQLNRQMASGELFPFFDEMEIKFPPTYKFDNGTKVYDTSEKQRIPAWTDRILSMSKTQNIKQLYYNSCQEIIFLDHRPVVAVFKVSVNIIDEHKKAALLDYLYKSYKEEYGGINNLFFNNSNLSYLLDGDDDGTLPPPSSEKTKWWIDGGLPAKVTIPQLERASAEGDMVINPKLPANPFAEAALTMPEFVSKNLLIRATGD